jgi:predicted nuclease with TOPRIM domain
MMAELETKQASLRNSLLRISGAIQVLEELQSEAKPAEEDEARSLETTLVSSPLDEEQSVPEKLRMRLDELRKEFETGRVRLGEVEMQQSRLRETLLRISGAIQVLEELLAEVTQEEEIDVRTLETPLVSS